MTLVLAKHRRALFVQHEQIVVGDVCDRIQAVLVWPTGLHLHSSILMETGEFINHSSRGRGGLLITACRNQIIQGSRMISCGVYYVAATILGYVCPGGLLITAGVSFITSRG